MLWRLDDEAFLSFEQALHLLLQAISRRDRAIASFAYHQLGCYTRYLDAKPSLHANVRQFLKQPRICFDNPEENLLWLLAFIFYAEIFQLEEITVYQTAHTLYVCKIHKNLEINKELRITLMNLCVRKAEQITLHDEDRKRYMEELRFAWYHLNTKQQDILGKLHDRVSRIDIAPSVNRCKGSALSLLSICYLGQLALCDRDMLSENITALYDSDPIHYAFHILQSDNAESFVDEIKSLFSILRMLCIAPKTYQDNFQHLLSDDIAFYMHRRNLLAAGILLEILLNRHLVGSQYTLAWLQEQFNFLIHPDNQLDEEDEQDYSPSAEFSKSKVSDDLKPYVTGTKKIDFEHMVKKWEMYRANPTPNFYSRLYELLSSNIPILSPRTEILPLHLRLSARLEKQKKPHTLSKTQSAPIAASSSSHEHTLVTRSYSSENRYTQFSLSPRSPRSSLCEELAAATSSLETPSPNH